MNDDRLKKLQERIAILEGGNSELVAYSDRLRRERDIYRQAIDNVAAILFCRGRDYYY
jgi:hypothetical protein